MIWIRYYFYICMGAALAGDLVFIGAYLWGSGWRKTSAGQNLMAFTAVLAMLESMVFLALLSPGWQRLVLVMALLGYAALPAVTWWRTILLLLTQWRTRKQLKKGANHDIQA